MEKSIENIWEKGFMAEDAIVAPRINNLYELKSRNIMDQMGRLYKWNMIGLYVFALFMAVYSLLMGLPIWLMLLLIILFVAPAVYSRNQMKTRQPKDQFSNVYDYMKSFNDWLEAKITRNIKLARYYYPMSVILAGCMIWFAPHRERTIEKLLIEYPDMPMVFGMPLYFILPILSLALIMGIFAKRIYRVDVGLIYGRALSKLKELISDLEELRK